MIYLASFFVYNKSYWGYTTKSSYFYWEINKLNNYSIKVLR